METKKEVEKLRTVYLDAKLNPKSWDSSWAASEYIYALEMHNAYLEGYLNTLEELLESWHLRPSNPHSSSKEPLVQVSHGLREVTPSTVNQDRILVTEDLTEPTSIERAAGVKIHREPKALFDTSSVERGEEFGGANIEKAIGCGHGKYLHHDSLTSLVSEIEIDMMTEFIAREKEIASAIDGTINTVIAAVNAERIKTLQQFASRLRKQILSGTGF
jgi:hypothetical protein